MYEVEKEGQCITEHPGYAACCLNSWGLSIAAKGLKTKAKKSYATTKTDKNAAEPELVLFAYFYFSQHRYFSSFACGRIPNH